MFCARACGWRTNSESIGRAKCAVAPKRWNRRSRPCSVPGLGVLRKETAAEQFAVHRAKAAVAEADEKLRTIKRWSREFDGRVQPLVKQTEKLHTVFSNDMVQALAYLTQVIKTLAAYAETKLPNEVSTSPGPANTSPEESSPNKQASGSGVVVGEDTKKP